MNQVVKDNLEEQGYKSIAQAATPRMLEANALIEAARRISVAFADTISEDNSNPEAFEALRKALRLNWRLWSIFNAELLFESNDIPQEIRANMLILCKYIDTRTIHCLAAPTANNIAILIDINHHIASGLMSGTQQQDIAAA